MLPFSHGSTNLSHQLLPSLSITNLSVPSPFRRWRQWIS
jgi:hypothetical protein